MTKINDNWVAYLNTNLPYQYQATYAKITGYSDASISKSLKRIKKEGVEVTKDMNFIGKAELLDRIAAWESQSNPTTTPKDTVTVNVPLAEYPPEAEYEEPDTESKYSSTADGQSTTNFSLVNVSAATVDHLVTTIKSMAEDGDKFNIAISINKGNPQ